MSTTADLEGDGPWASTSPGQTDVYHTDPDCKALGSAINPRPIRQRTIEWHGLDECPFCDPAQDSPNNPGVSIDE